MVAIPACCVILLAIVFMSTKTERAIAKANSLAKKGDYAAALNLLDEVNDPIKTSDTHAEIIGLLEDAIRKSIDDGEYEVTVQLLESYPELSSYNVFYASLRGICPHENTTMESKEASCVENGYKNIVCELCGFVNGSIYEATGHDYTVNVTKDATCDEDGNEHMVCKICNYEENRVLSKRGHNYENKDIVAPLCEKGGERECICKVCGYSYTEEISAIGHEWSAATCTEDGTCVHCGKIKEVAYGHTWIKDSYNDRGLICKHCDVNYPVSAVLKTYGFPYSDDDIYIESMEIINVKVYEEDKAFFVCTLSGYCYDWVGSLDVEVVDQNGNLVLDEWGLSISSTVPICGEGDFTSFEFYVETPISGTYYIKIKYVW